LTQNKDVGVSTGVCVQTVIKPNVLT